MVAEIPFMRSDVLTKHERQVLLAFLKDKKRNDTVNQVLFHLEKDWHSVLFDVKLLLRLKRLANAGY